MFDNSQSFFENKERRTECDTKLKKLKNHFKPKNVLYKLEVPPQISRHLKLCPLELKPTKLSDSSLEYYRDKETTKSKRRSKKSESKYNYENSNQQCVDDSILTGLQTVIDLCGLLEECDKENKLKLDREKDKKNARNKKVPSKKKSLQLADNPNSSSSSNENNSLREQRDPHKISKPSSEPSSFRKLLIRASRSCIINKSPFKSSSILSVPEENISQSSTPSVNSLVTLNTQASQETVFSQTQSIELPKECIQVYASKVGKGSKKKKKSMKSIKEESHVCSNTPSSPGISCEQNKRPCAELKSSCMYSENPADDVRGSKSTLRHRSAEDDIDQYWTRRNQMAQTESHEVLRSSSKPSKLSSLHSITDERTPSKEGSTTGLIKEHGETPEPKITRQATLSAKCFPPLEIVDNDAQHTQQRPLCRRTFTNEDMLVVHPECAPYEEGTSIPHKRIPTRHTAIYDASMLCNQDFPTPLEKNQLDVKRSRPGVPIVQPVLGFCTSAKCGGEHLKSIKYALVKISEFIGFSTYEIMKPYKDKPKQMPTCIAEIFVTSPVQKREDQYIVTRAVSVERQTELPCVCVSSRVRQEPSSQVSTEPLAQSDTLTCQCKESLSHKSRQLSRTSQKEGTASVINSTQPIDTNTHACECQVVPETPSGNITFGRTQSFVTQEPSHKQESLTSRPPVLEQSVVLREFDTYREPSKADKPFQVHSKEAIRVSPRQSTYATSNSRMGSQTKESSTADRSKVNLDRPTMEGSNSATESVTLKRSALRTTESGKMYNKSTHFREPTKNTSQLDNQSSIHKKTQDNVLQNKKSRSKTSNVRSHSNRQQSTGSSELNQESFHSAR